MSLVWSSDAKSQVEKIYNWYKEMFGVTVAYRVKLSIRDVTELYKTNPLMGKKESEIVERAFK